MSDQSNIPVLTDLIETGMEITLSDLGLDDDLEIEADDTDIDLDDAVVDKAAPDLGAIDPFKDNPALEYAIQNILEQHMELAWQEIRLAIRRELNKPRS